MGWVKLNTSFFTNRKTRLLRQKIGFAANWVMPRLWCYAAENQPDGDFSSYDYEEIRKIVDFEGDAEKLVLHLQTVGFLDGMKIHDWMEHNGYSLASYKVRAQKGAAAKWTKFHADKDTTLKTREDRGEYRDNVVSIASSNASSRNDKHRK